MQNLEERERVTRLDSYINEGCRGHWRVQLRARRPLRVHYLNLNSTDFEIMEKQCKYYTTLPFLPTSTEMVARPLSVV